MKLVQSKPKSSNFTPFEITLKVSDPGEARLLWHVMNKLRLWDSINDGTYGGASYITPARHFNDGTDEICDFIEQFVKIQ